MPFWQPSGETTRYVGRLKLTLAAAGAKTATPLLLPCVQARFTAPTPNSTGTLAVESKQEAAQSQHSTQQQEASPQYEEHLIINTQQVGAICLVISAVIQQQRSRVASFHHMMSSPALTHDYFCAITCCSS